MALPGVRRTAEISFTAAHTKRVSLQHIWHLLQGECARLVELVENGWLGRWFGRFRDESNHLLGATDGCRCMAGDRSLGAVEGFGGDIFQEGEIVHMVGCGLG